jgi:hypothetical protein
LLVETLRMVENVIVVHWIQLSELLVTLTGLW